MNEERVLRGEFIGALLFCIVLPLIAAVSVTLQYVRHAG